MVVLAGIVTIAGFVDYLAEGRQISGFIGVLGVVAFLILWGRSGDHYTGAPDLQRADEETARPMPPGPAPPMGSPHFRGDGDDH